MDPKDPEFNNIPLVQDEDGVVVRRVANVEQWVTPAATAKLMKEADKLLACESIPPIEKARVRADALKTINAVDKDIIRTEDVSKSNTFQAAQRKAHNDMVLKSRPLVNPTILPRSRSGHRHQSHRRHRSSSHLDRSSPSSLPRSRSRYEFHHHRDQAQRDSHHTFSHAPSALHEPNFQDQHRKSPQRRGRQHTRSSSRYRSTSPHRKSSRRHLDPSYRRPPSSHDYRDGRHGAGGSRRRHFSPSRSRSRSPLHQRGRHVNPTRRRSPAFEGMESRRDDLSASPKSVIISRPRKF
jgi:hypothetical protein